MGFNSLSDASESDDSMSLLKIQNQKTVSCLGFHNELKSDAKFDLSERFLFLLPELASFTRARAKDRQKCESMNSGCEMGVPVPLATDARKAF